MRLGRFRLHPGLSEFGVERERESLTAIWSIIRTIKKRMTKGRAAELIRHQTLLSFMQVLLQAFNFIMSSFRLGGLYCVMPSTHRSSTQKTTTHTNPNITSLSRGHTRISAQRSKNVIKRQWKRNETACCTVSKPGWVVSVWRESELSDVSKLLNTHFSGLFKRISRF